MKLSTIQNASVLKKGSLLVTGFVTLAILLSFIITPALALGETVTIRGNVNKVIPGPSLGPIQNQPVSVVCGGVTKNATTSASGLYTVTFTEPGCSRYSSVSAKSNYNSSLITRQVSVSGEYRATIDLNF